MLDTQTIADHYGIEHQTGKAVEELKELETALENHQTLKTTLTHNSVIEEIADVEIMLEQLKYLMNISEIDINKVKYYKIIRQHTRMAAECSAETNDRVDITQIGMALG